MSGFGDGGGYPEPVHPEPGWATQKAGKWGAFYGAFRVAFGLISVAFAIDNTNVEDEVSFRSDEWRIVFGATGVVVALTGLRGWLQAQRGHRWEVAALIDVAVGEGGRRVRAGLLGVDHLLQGDGRRDLRRVRAYGWLMFAIGLWYQLASWSDGSARPGLGVDSWAGPLYGLGSLLLMLHGLIMQINPRWLVKYARVKEGHGTHTTATVLRATDQGTFRDKAQVQVELTVDFNGRLERHSRKILMDRAQLARIEGATVDIVADPADPKIFDVKWDTLREAPPA
jgi:hypothetical protein